MCQQILLMAAIAHLCGCSMTGSYDEPNRHMQGHIHVGDFTDVDPDVPIGTNSLGNSQAIGLQSP